MNREPRDPFFDIVENQGFNPIDSKNLRTAFQDPVITGLLEEASLANEILRESGGVDEAVSLAKELDENCKLIIGNVIKVSGVARSLDTDGSVEGMGGYLYDTTNSFPDSQYLYASSMVFNGFIVEQNDNHSGPEIRVLARAYQADQSEDVAPAYFSVETQEAVLDFGAMMSKDRAQAWMEVFEPELLDEIDERVMNAEGRGDAIKSLEGMKINFLDRYKGEDLNVASTAFARYMAEAIDINPAYPFLVSVAGDMSIISNDGTIATAEALLIDAAMSISDIRPVKFKSGEMEEWQLYIHGVVHIPDNSAEVSVLVPISSIDSLEDTAQLFD